MEMEVNEQCCTAKDPKPQDNLVSLPAKSFEVDTVSIRWVVRFPARRRGLGDMVREHSHEETW